MSDTRLRMGGFAACAAAAAIALAVAGCAGSPSSPASGDPPAQTPAAGSDRDAARDAGPPGAEESPRELEPEPPAHLEISLCGVEGLRLVEYLMKGERPGGGTVHLTGAVTVTISNPSAAPVRLVHMDPANLVFTRLDTGERFSVLHPCEPGLLLGSVVEPGRTDRDDEARVFARSVFTLGPGETRTFEMGDDWGCSGGPWKPVPSPGEYLLEYRVHRLADGWRPALGPEAGTSIGDRTAAARAALAGDRFWEGAYRSQPVRLVLGPPKRKRLEY